jgi:hypothetical protein
MYPPYFIDENFYFYFCISDVFKFKKLWLILFFRRLKNIISLNMYDKNIFKKYKYLMQENSLEFDEWIKLAETKNFFLTSKDYTKLIPGKEYIAVPADHIRILFLDYAIVPECDIKRLSLEYGEDYHISPNKNYLSQDLYQREKTIIIPTGKVIEKETGVYQSEGFAIAILSIQI